MEQPKNYQVHTIVLAAILFGGVSSVFDFMLFGTFANVSPEALQTAWFCLSVITEVILIFSLRTRFAFFRARRPSFMLAFLSLAVLVAAVLIPFIPFGTDIFHFIRPDLSFVMIIAALSVGYFIATEAVKRFYYHHFRNGHTLGVKRGKSSFTHA